MEKFYDKKSSIIASLDQVANKLEAKGNFRLALAIDRVSNRLESRDPEEEFRSAIEKYQQIKYIFNKPIIKRKGSKSLSVDIVSKPESEIEHLKDNWIRLLYDGGDIPGTIGKGLWRGACITKAGINHPSKASKTLDPILRDIEEAIEKDSEDLKEVFSLMLEPYRQRDKKLRDAYNRKSTRGEEREPEEKRKEREPEEERKERIRPEEEK